MERIVIDASPLTDMFGYPGSASNSIYDEVLPEIKTLYIRHEQVQPMQQVMHAYLEK